MIILLIIICICNSVLARCGKRVFHSKNINPARRLRAAAPGRAGFAYSGSGLFPAAPCPTGEGLPGRSTDSRIQNE
ncbi:hypothetical protein CDU00_01875 [Cronobacter sakazakii]|nr:hypothetical protein [Cronobacter sakazakii]EGT4354275.1 hypothetical protein [Cronobacter sakazakii]EGT5185605.1 hypothetical protein [Cronobacter sakazakii]EGT5768050.1 hypothetical protein [Cronobacter sakazakii]EGZ6859488.1 hypothetical protein [Cronobacter sakazakii]